MLLVTMLFVIYNSLSLRTFVELDQRANWKADKDESLYLFMYLLFGMRQGQVSAI